MKYPIGVQDIKSLIKDGYRSADLEQVRKLFTAFLADIPYSVRRKSDERDCERDFQYTFYLILKMLSCYKSAIIWRAAVVALSLVPRRAAIFL